MTEIDWRQLPSLSSLRSFEATARLDGFSAAARALNVTPAAVAQQVRALEAELGTALVRREGRGLALTPEGRQLYVRLSEGFATIAEGVGSLRRDQSRRSVRVSATQGFAQWILMPALSRFWQKHPGIRVSLDITSSLADLSSGAIDIAIRSTPHQPDWPGTESEVLIRSRYIVIAAPELAARVSTPADLANLPWILDPTNHVDSTRLRLLGIERDDLRVTEVSSPTLEVASAIQGYGVMFGVESIVKPELDAGRLVEVPTEGLPEVAYHIVTAPGPKRANVAQFIRWMRVEFGDVEQGARAEGRTSDDPARA